MADRDSEREYERFGDYLHVGYLEQLISDMTHILYDLVLLCLLAGRTRPPRCLRLLRGKILNLPLGADIGKHLVAMDKLWGRRLLQKGADFEGWIAERERARSASVPQEENAPNRDESSRG